MIEACLGKSAVQQTDRADFVHGRLNLRTENCFSFAPVPKTAHPERYVVIRKMNQTLEEEIITLEKELHSPEARTSRFRLEEIISDDFREIGASGKLFDKAEVLQRLPTEKPPLIRASNFEIFVLSPKLIQVIYESHRVDESGRPTRETRRSSIWRKEEQSWRMLFHQGTFSS